MITELLLALAVPLPPVASASSTGGAVVQDPPVRVWLSKRNAVERGDRLKVRVRTQEDGYLLVLHADPQGRVRVIFPLDPVDDHFIRGGRDYEVRGRGDREAITVYETSGLGTVFAAFSRDPFRFDGYVRNTHWDYVQADAWRVGDDVEGDLTALVDAIARGSGFDYDLVYYDVYDTVAYSRRYNSGYYRSSFYDPFYCDVFYCSPSYLYGGHRHGLHISIGVGFGHGYYWPSYYDPFYYDPFYYDPYYYGPYYDPFFFGFGFHHRPHYGGFYRSRRTVYVGNPVTFRDRGFTFKPSDRSFGESVDVRRRSTPIAATQRRPTAGASGATAPARRTPADAARRPTGSTSSPPERRPAPSNVTVPRRTPSETPRQPGATPARRQAPATPGRVRSRTESSPAATPGGTPSRPTIDTESRSGRRGVGQERAEQGEAGRHYVVRIRGGQRSTTSPAAEARDDGSRRNTLTPRRESADRSSARALSPGRSSPREIVRPTPRSETRSERVVAPSRTPNQRPSVRQTTPRSTTRATPSSPRSIQRPPQRSRSPARLSRPSVRSRPSGGRATPSRRASPPRPRRPR